MEAGGGAQGGRREHPPARPCMSTYAGSPQEGAAVPGRHHTLKGSHCGCSPHPPQWEWLIPGCETPVQGKAAGARLGSTPRWAFPLRLEPHLQGLTCTFTPAAWTLFSGWLGRNHPKQAKKH